MEILLNSIVVIIAITIPAWYMWLSPMARSTNELERLNKLTTPFAEKKKNPEALLEELRGVKWKYHQDKADYFIAIAISWSITQNRYV